MSVGRARGSVSTENDAQLIEQNARMEEFKK